MTGTTISSSRRGRRVASAAPTLILTLISGALAVSIASVGSRPALAQSDGRAGGGGAAPGEIGQPGPPARELTLDDVLTMARRANRSLVAERSRLDQAQATIDRAWTTLFPTLAAQGKYTRNNAGFSFAVGPGAPTLTIQPVDQLDAVFSATVPLLTPAAYPALKSVKLSAEATRENVRSAEDSVLFSVAQTFYAAEIADEVVVARKSSIAVARATFDNAKTRFSAGAVTKVDVDRAELAVLRAEQAEREAELARDQTYRSLGTLIQFEQPFRVRVAVPSGSGAASGAPEATGALASALHLRPEFRALEASAQASEAERSGQAWRWAPSLSGFANARFFNYDNFRGDSHSWAVGAQLDWVIFDAGVRDASRRLAAAQAAETAARAEVLRENIGDDLFNGRRQLETKVAARKTSEQSVELALETVELVRVQYEAGQATQIDLLTAQDNLVSAREALAQAHYDVAIADLTLRRTAGTFPGR
jgi:outer membrane protein TolC